MSALTERTYLSRMQGKASDQRDPPLWPRGVPSAGRLCRPRDPNMTFSRNSFPHILSAALVAGVALVPAGCGGDGVNSYTVPKTTDTGPAKANPHAGMGGPEGKAGEYR